MVGWLDLLWIVIGGVITAVIFVIRESYKVGKNVAEFVTKEEMNMKFKDLDLKYEDKFNDIDNRIEKKFDDINKKLNSMNDILIKQETREYAKNCYEQQLKENEKATLERLCLSINDLCKKQDTLNNMVINHESIIGTFKVNNQSQISN